MNRNQNARTDNQRAQQRQHRITIASNSDQWRKIPRWRVRINCAAALWQKARVVKKRFPRIPEPPAAPAQFAIGPPGTEMIPAVNALQPGSAQRQQIRGRYHQTRRAVNSPAPRSPPPQTAVAEIKQRWMKDKTGMLHIGLRSRPSIAGGNIRTKGSATAPQTVAVRRA